MSFNTNESRQCYNVIVMISPADVCDDLSLESVTLLMGNQTGIGEISVEPSQTQVTVVDSEEPRCGGCDMTV